MGVAQPALANPAVPACLVGVATVSDDPEDATNAMALGDIFPEAEIETTAMDPAFQYYRQQQPGPAVYSTIPICE